MPIDKSFIDPILNPFRDMIKDLENKNLTGENYDKIIETIKAIEKLADESNDFNAFNAKVTEKNYYLNFSNYYSAALSEGAQEQVEKDGYDDSTLLKNTLKAYEDALVNLKGHKDEEKLTEPIKKVLEIGKSGVSFPVFLRMVEEQGLNKAMDGTITLRKYLLKDIQIAQDFYMPIQKAMYEEELKAYDELKAKAPFGVPDSFEYELIRQKIEWKYEPKLIKWRALIHMWEEIIDDVYDWLDSFCSFAPYDPRWKTPGATPEIVKKNIERTQETTPYYMIVREKRFKDYYGLTWNDIWVHETYLNEKKANRIPYSDARIELIKKTYEQLKPGAKPTDDLILKSEEMYNNKTHINPEYRKEVSEKALKMYEEAYGKKPDGM